MTIGMWNSYPFAFVKRTVFGLLSLLFLVRYSSEQWESNPVPIISALPDGQSVQDCSDVIHMRSYWELTASPCSKLSSPIKWLCNEGTWGDNMLNSFIPGLKTPACSRESRHRTVSFCSVSINLNFPSI